MGVYDVASNSLQSRGNFRVRAERLVGNSGPGCGGGGIEDALTTGSSNGGSSASSSGEGAAYCHLVGI